MTWEDIQTPDDMKIFRDWLIGAGEKEYIISHLEYLIDNSRWPKFSHYTVYWWYNGANNYPKFKEEQNAVIRNASFFGAQNRYFTIDFETPWEAIKYFCEVE